MLNVCHRMNLGLRILAAIILTFFVVGLVSAEMLHAGMISDPCSQECHSSETHSKGETTNDVCDCLCHMAATALVQCIGDLQAAVLLPLSHLSADHLAAPDGPVAEILLPPQLA